MNNIQKADPYKPILSSNNGKAPLTLRLVVNRNDHFMEGVPGDSYKNETYVLLSALPVELRNRVELAIQALRSAL